MENIPEQLRQRLIEAGYDRVERLPNVAVRTEWASVQNDCRFSNPDLNEVINALFPVPQPGKSFFDLIHCFQ